MLLGADVNDKPVRADLVSVSWNSAILAFAIDCRSHVQGIITSNGEIIAQAETSRREAIGRLSFDGLPPDTECELEIDWSSGQANRKFTTLPRPEGEPIWSCAVLGDSHVADEKLEKHGRLLVESLCILREAVHEMNRESVDFLLIPGDLTDKGTEAEYDMVEEALSELSCPYMAVPGDHDMKQARGRHLWEERFGPPQWVVRRNGLLIVGCDTSSGRLGQSGYRWISRHPPEDGEMLILLSHRQLAPDDYVMDVDKVVEDYVIHEGALRTIESRGMIFAGHKNVPTSAIFGRLVQINVPQPVQYPCGYLIVRCFSNGVYLTFQPMFSDVLNECSRQMGNACNQARIRDEYRIHGISKHWNTLYFAEEHD